MHITRTSDNVPGYFVANAALGALFGVITGAVLLTAQSDLARLLFASETPFVTVVPYFAGFATTFATVVAGGAIMLLPEEPKV